MKKVFFVITFLLITIITYGQAPIFYESFDTNKGKGGNSGGWQRLKDYVPALSDQDWDFGKFAYQGDKCLRYGHTNLGTSGKVTTPSINIKGMGVLFFKAGSWITASEVKRIKLSMSGAMIIDGNERKESVNVDLNQGEFGNYIFKFEVQEGVEAIKISFETVAEKNNRFFLDEVVVSQSSFSINISQLGYSTLYSMIPYQLPDDISAYKIVRNEEQTNIKITPLSIKVIPAETGILLKGKPGSYNTTFLMDGGPSLTDNILLGQLVSRKVTPKLEKNQIYVLNSGPNGVGFYWQVEGGVSAVVGAGRCYLEANIKEEQAKQGLSLDEEIITTIDHTFPSTDSKEIYDLTGRRVQQLGHGFYIVNGKKVIR